ncbi:ABC transporter ATP-binding protein [Phenylobacterium sp.]|uniref:ABC transporter ATP-binding protein n=1 Tax=Phenylobacterium sp. TaxID=1871053 RepID=UPI002734FDAB|nr:ABC transporter ATP-binding protein [Phenylobacterium sp.]MDP3659808.1 ABC transporter ATP-binding protein [Phenylobacterium sp.]
MIAPDPDTPLLAVRDLRKSVPGGRVLFDGLDLDLRAGDFVAVTGESGVGKSTLLNLIAGLDQADCGSIRLDGDELGGLDEDQGARLRRERIGFVFQAFHVLPHLTLAQNVALPLILQRQGQAASLQRARAMMAEVGLGGRDADYPAQLSGGELQRVAIARALVHRPALILADEPTGNLDPETAGRIMELLTRQVRSAGAAAILVTHSAAAASAADRSLTLTRHGLTGADAA